MIHRSGSNGYGFQTKMKPKWVYFSHWKSKSTWIYHVDMWRTNGYIWIYDLAVEPVVISQRLDKYVYKSIDSIGTPLKVGSVKIYILHWWPKVIDGWERNKSYGFGSNFLLFNRSSFFMSLWNKPIHVRHILFWPFVCFALQWNRRQISTKLAENPKTSITLKTKPIRSFFFLFQRYECNNNRQNSSCLVYTDDSLWFDFESLVAKASHTSKTTETNKQTNIEWAAGEKKNEKAKKNMMDIFRVKGIFLFFYGRTRIAHHESNVFMCHIFIPKNQKMILLYGYWQREWTTPIIQ